MTRNEWIQWATKKLMESAIETARLDAEVLLAHVLHIERIQLHIYPEKEVDQDLGEQYKVLISRRQQQCPVAYLMGMKEFMGLPFQVTPDVLIPRPDTETLVEAVLQWVKECRSEEEELLMADIGTGSGAIAVSLAYYATAIQILATDLSPEALAVAKSNAVRNGVSDRIRFYAGDLLEPLQHQTASLDALISNPPYITEDEMKILPVSVGEYEPSLALEGGKDGLDNYRRMLREGMCLLKPGALVAFEMGWQQGRMLKALMEAAGLENLRILQDLTGLDRVVMGFKKNWQSQD